MVIADQHRKDVDLLEWVQRSDMKMVGELEHLPRENKRERVRLFSMEKKRLRGHLRVFCTT